MPSEKTKIIRSPTPPFGVDVCKEVALKHETMLLCMSMNSRESSPAAYHLPPACFLPTFWHHCSANFTYQAERNVSEASGAATARCLAAAASAAADGRPSGRGFGLPPHSRHIILLKRLDDPLPTTHYSPQSAQATALRSAGNSTARVPLRGPFLVKHLIRADRVHHNKNNEHSDLVQTQGRHELCIFSNASRKHLLSF